jgi:hypothetical protein
VKNVTVKPDLTIGLMPEQSSGIEPTFPYTYTRRARHEGELRTKDGVLIGSFGSFSFDLTPYVGPIYELKAADEPYDVLREWMKPIQIECTGYRIQEEPLDHYPTYEEFMAQVEMQRQREVDYVIEQNMKVMAAVASQMDWEEDEEITEPGLGPDPCPPAPAEELPPEPVALRPGEYPQIDSEGMAKTDRCYLCATGRQITRFFRTADDSVIACGRCIYDHLGYDIQEDGLLIPVVSEL